jgi:hypothetical protein
MVPALMALVFAAFVVLYLADHGAYLAILRALNENPFPHPFLDTRFVTAQVECWRRGVDVYASNPCDPLGRTQDYSPLWLRLHVLGQCDAWTPVFGLAVDLLFVRSLFAMPWRRENPFGTVVAAATLLSWASAFALERGNTDLLMFAAAVLVARLLARPSGLARDAGYAVALGAGLLKIYPLVLLALLVRERPRRMLLTGGICAAVLAAFAFCWHDELARIGANMATGVFGAMFGARTIPYGLLDLWQIARGVDVNDAVPPGPLGTLLLVAMSAGCVAAAASLARDASLRSALVGLDGRTRSLLLVGAVLCTGVFFGHQNIGYRSVLLLLLLPGLGELLGVVRTGRFAVQLRVTAVLLVAAAWGGDLEGTGPGWLAVQLAWWWITAVLLAIVAAEFAPLLAVARRWRGRGGASAARRPPVAPRWAAPVA